VVFGGTEATPTTPIATATWSRGTPLANRKVGCATKTTPAMLQTVAIKSIMRSRSLRAKTAISAASIGLQN